MYHPQREGYVGKQRQGQKPVIQANDGIQQILEIDRLVPWYCVGHVKRASLQWPASLCRRGCRCLLPGLAGSLELACLLLSFPLEVSQVDPATLEPFDKSTKLDGFLLEQDRGGFEVLRAVRNPAVTSHLGPEVPKALARPSEWI